MKEAEEFTLRSPQIKTSRQSHDNINLRGQSQHDDTVFGLLDEQQFTHRNNFLDANPVPMYD